MSRIKSRIPVFIKKKWKKRILPKFASTCSLFDCRSFPIWNLKLMIIVSIFVKLFLILVLHLRQFFIVRIFVKRATDFYTTANILALSLSSSSPVCRQNGSLANKKSTLRRIILNLNTMIIDIDTKLRLIFIWGFLTLNISGNLFQFGIVG